MQIKTMCNRDCPDACGIVATVENGRVTRIEGDPEHPVTAGFLCYRTNKFLERQYDPDRITTPLLRKGDGFEAISWDRAIEMIASKLERVLAESGPAAIFHYRSGGSMGLMKHVTEYFFEKIGPVAMKSGDPKMVELATAAEGGCEHSKEALIAMVTEDGDTEEN